MAAGDDITLGEIARGLERIEAKLDSVTGDHEQRLREIEAAGVSSHEERIRRVEKWMYSVPVSALLALGTLIGALIK